jgi:hypothetical protein
VAVSIQTNIQKHSDSEGGRGASSSSSRGSSSSNRQEQQAHGGSNQATPTVGPADPGDRRRPRRSGRSTGSRRGALFWWELRPTRENGGRRGGGTIAVIRGTYSAAPSGCCRADFGRIRHRGGEEGGGGGWGIALTGPLAAVSVRVRGRPFSGGGIVEDADEGRSRDDDRVVLH